MSKQINFNDVRNSLKSILVRYETSKNKTPIAGKAAGLYLGKMVLAGVLLLFVWYLFAHLPVTYRDWNDSFRPAALHWDAPYQKSWGIFNPPWLFPFLYPIALLPSSAGGGLLMLISIVAVAVYVRSPFKMLFVVCSASMVGLMTLGQLDALLLFGLMIPKGLGIPILMLKPQAVFLTIIPRLNRWSILATVLILGVSVLIWGFWWNKVLGVQPYWSGNVSLFPYTILPGVVLAFYGVKRKNDAFLCIASLCFAPYFMIHSMLPAIAATIKETNDWRWWTVITVGTWLYFLMMKWFLW